MSEEIVVKVSSKATQAEAYRQIGEALKQSSDLLNVIVAKGRQRYAIESCTFGTIYPGDCKMRLEKLELIQLPPSRKDRR